MFLPSPTYLWVHDVSNNASITGLLWHYVSQNRTKITGTIIIHVIMIIDFQILILLIISQEISFLIDVFVLKARNIHIYNTWWLCRLFEDFYTDDYRYLAPIVPKYLWPNSNKTPLLNYFGAVFLLRRLDGQQIDHQIYLKFQKMIFLDINYYLVKKKIQYLTF